MWDYRLSGVNLDYSRLDEELKDAANQLVQQGRRIDAQDPYLDQWAARRIELSEPRPAPSGTPETSVPHELPGGRGDTASLALSHSHCGFGGILVKISGDHCSRNSLLDLLFGVVGHRGQAGEALLQGKRTVLVNV
jgi:hypothetical protein